MSRIFYTCEFLVSEFTVFNWQLGSNLPCEESDCSRLNVQILHDVLPLDKNRGGIRGENTSGLPGDHC
jgi:hypothetical protein